MIRNDFVSNSSSSSYIVSLTRNEYESIKEYPKTILDLIIKNKKWHFGELGDPPDRRGSEFQKYAMNLYYGRPPKGHDPKKYCSIICPFIYQQCSEFILFKEDLPKIQKYYNCCLDCTDNKECRDKRKIERIIENLDHDNVIVCFELRNTDNFYIDDEDFSRLNDPHVIETENNH